MSDTLGELVEDMVQNARKRICEVEDCLARGIGTDAVVSREIEGWGVALSISRHDDIEHWHLSAVLVPRGRSSTEADWETLGRLSFSIVQASGCADVQEILDGILTPLETTHPNAVHHWAWHPDSSPLDPEAVRQMKDIFASIGAVGIEGAVPGEIFRLAELLRRVIDAEASLGAVLVGGEHVGANLSAGLRSLDVAARYARKAEHPDVAEALERLRPLFDQDMDRSCQLLRELRISIRMQLDRATEAGGLSRVPSASVAASATPHRRRGPKIGRNHACPCGSGKKYKKCCGKP